MSGAARILVFSDSHRAVQPIRRLLALYAGQVSRAVHLGDHAGDLLALRGEYDPLELTAVAGNCDPGRAAEPEIWLRVNGKKILLLHGHRQQVKMGTDRLAYYAEEKEADACLFGHTHTPAVLEAGPVFLFNPGSIGRPRDGQPTYGLLSVSADGVIQAAVLTYTGEAV